MGRPTSTKRVVKEITKVRANNNHLWMDLMVLALMARPKEAKQIISRINKNDKEISGWLEKLRP